MQENVELQALNTFGLSARARYFCVIDTLAALQDALRFAHEKQLPVFILGGGSNILLRDNVPGLVLHMQIKGIAKLSEAEGAVRVQVSCGENWHAFVTYCLAQGWHGLEHDGAQAWRWTDGNALLPHQAATQDTHLVLHGWHPAAFRSGAEAGARIAA